MSLVVVLAHYGYDVNPSRTVGKMRCPVHEERRASCSYDLDRGLLNCFSCGFQGDAVNLIMAKENVDVATAITRRDAIAGSSGAPVRGADAGPPSPISGRASYKPRYKRVLPARRRGNFD